MEYEDKRFTTNIFHAEYAAGSTLSIDAEEFVPRFPAMSATYMQERMENFQREYIKTYYQQYQYQQPSSDEEQRPIEEDPSTASPSCESSKELENIALEKLNVLIHCLQQSPGQFDTLAANLYYIFEGMANNCYVLSISIEEIFEQAIRNSNFRNMAAKLYSLLHNLNPNQDSLFLTLLRCKLECHQQQLPEYIQQNQIDEVRATVTFLSKVYLELRDEDSANNFIAEHIVFILKELLSLEDNSANLGCICLILKLAGNELADDCPKDMRDIANRFKAKNSSRDPLTSHSDSGHVKYEAG